MMASLLRRLGVDVQPGEVQALGWTWVYFYAVLASYYVLRPIRDEAGVAGGVDNLSWLFTGTLIGMALANPAFSMLVARLPRVRFVSWTYRFFMLNLVLFFFLLQGTSGLGNIWVGRVFFIWTAVFNLFVPSVFWAFMSDLFTREQAKRLFGVISAAGTLGAATGSLLTASLATRVPPVYLLFLSAIFLEVAVLAVRTLSRQSERLRTVRGAASQEVPIGGGVFAGMRHALRSPYLLNICLYMLFYTVLSTFLYFQQAELVDRTFTDRAARTVFFARVDLLTNALTFVLQIFALGNLLKLAGISITLAVLPAMSAAGFLTLGLLPTAGVLVWFQALRRAGNFAVARPTREVLFTVVTREDRYKAKSFIDTFVYRTGDQLGAWSYTLLGMAGVTVAGTAWVAVPLSVAWIVNGLWLGKRQERIAAQSATRPQDAPLPSPDRSLRTAPLP
jgi:ATP:ADP antiporter, AAA family